MGLDDRVACDGIFTGNSPHPPDTPDPFASPPPTPARIAFEYAFTELRRREIHAERCLSMALYWLSRAELAYERFTQALTLAEQAAGQIK